MNNFADNILTSAFSGLTLSDPANAERVASMLDQFGLRWNVSKQQMHLPDGTATKFSAIVRDDNNDVFTMRLTASGRIGHPSRGTSPESMVTTGLHLSSGGRSTSPSAAATPSHLLGGS